VVPHRYAGETVALPGRTWFLIEVSSDRFHGNKTNSLFALGTSRTVVVVAVPSLKTEALTDPFGRRR